MRDGSRRSEKIVKNRFAPLNATIIIIVIITIIVIMRGAVVKDGSDESRTSTMTMTYMPGRVHDVHHHLLAVHCRCVREDGL